MKTRTRTFLHATGLRLIGRLAVAVTLSAGPCGAFAQAPPAAVRAPVPNYAVPVPRGAVDTGRPILRLGVAANGAARDYVVILSPASQSALTTTLDYRMVPNGPIGSIGFPSSDDTPYVDRVYLNPAASMGFVRPEVVVGARINYRF